MESLVTVLVIINIINVALLATLSWLSIDTSRKLRKMRSDLNVTDKSVRQLWSRKNTPSTKDLYKPQLLLD
jgi:hypothetical protein